MVLAGEQEPRRGELQQHLLEARGGRQREVAPEGCGVVEDEQQRRVHGRHEPCAACEQQKHALDQRVHRDRARRSQEARRHGEVRGALQAREVHAEGAVAREVLQHKQGELGLRQGRRRVLVGERNVQQPGKHVEAQLAVADDVVAEVRVVAQQEPEDHEDLGDVLFARLGKQAARRGAQLKRPARVCHGELEHFGGAGREERKVAHTVQLRHVEQEQVALLGAAQPARVRRLVGEQHTERLEAQRGERVALRVGRGRERHPVVALAVVGHRVEQAAQERQHHGALERTRDVLARILLPRARLVGRRVDGLGQQRNEQAEHLDAVVEVPRRGALQVDGASNARLPNGKVHAADVVARRRIELFVGPRHREARVEEQVQQRVEERVARHHLLARAVGAAPRRCGREGVLHRQVALVAVRDDELVASLAVCLLLGCLLRGRRPAALVAQETRARQRRPQRALLEVFNVAVLAFPRRAFVNHGDDAHQHTAAVECLAHAVARIGGPRRRGAREQRAEPAGVVRRHRRKVRVVDQALEVQREHLNEGHNVLRCLVGGAP